MMILLGSVGGRGPRRIIPKFLAHSESGLKPSPEPVLTGFRYEAGI